MLDLLQGDLPDGLEPYDALAGRAGLPVETFLATARELIQCGCFRRISALVNHSQVGFPANALCVWQVPAGREDEVGRAIAAFTAVTRCYRRPVSDDWPYAIFCTIHGRKRAACEETARQIAGESGSDRLSRHFRRARIEKEEPQAVDTRFRDRFITLRANPAARGRTGGRQGNNSDEAL